MSANRNLVSGVGLSIEYLSYALNAVLYLRGVYPAASFKQVQHGQAQMSLMVSNDDGVTSYLGAVLSQAATWLTEGKLKALAVIIYPDSDPSETEKGSGIVERYTFQFRNTIGGGGSDNSTPAAAGANLCAAMRHLTASCGMLPTRKGTCTFEVISYNDASVLANPSKYWTASDPMELDGGDELPLRPFNAGGVFVDGFITFYSS